MAGAQVDRALVVVLAAEFQGFARSLHDRAAVEFVAHATAGNPLLAPIVRTHVMKQRRLDTGNAHASALTDDFGRLGLSLWPALALRYPSAPRWQHELGTLNAVRNAVAHSDEQRLETVGLRGGAIAPNRLVEWRNTLDALATALDAVTGAHLGTLFSIPAPW